MDQENPPGESISAITTKRPENKTIPVNAVSNGQFSENPGTKIFKMESTMTPSRSRNANHRNECKVKPETEKPKVLTQGKKKPTIVRKLPTTMPTSNRFTRFQLNSEGRLGISD
jgi:hypothetical protein